MDKNYYQDEEFTEFEEFEELEEFEESEDEDEDEEALVCASSLPSATILTR